MALLSGLTNKSKLYEYMLIMDPRLSDMEVGEIADSIMFTCKSCGATILNRIFLGRRELAFPINKWKEGIYYVFYCDATSAKKDVLQSVFEHVRYNDKIIRRHVFRVTPDLIPVGSELEFKEFVKP